MRKTMSYTGSGFDKRLRNLLFAFETAAPPPPPAPQPPAGSYIWLDASVLTGANGDPVSTWPDSSGNSLDASDNGNPSPTLALDFDGGGNKGVDFNGVNQSMGWIGQLDFTGVAGITVCGVMIADAAAGANLLSSFQTRDWGMFWDAPGALGVYTTVSVESSAVFPNAALLAFEMQQPRDGSDVPRFWLNGGTSAGAGSSFIGSIEDVPLGTALGQYIGGGFFMGVTIGDLLIYKRQFDAADRTEWGAYIASKYGL